MWSPRIGPEGVRKATSVLLRRSSNRRFCNAPTTIPSHSSRQLPPLAWCPRMRASVTATTHRHISVHRHQRAVASSTQSQNRRTMATTSSRPLYTSTVTKLPLDPATAPDDGSLEDHHVKNSKGETVVFRNPHPSAGALYSAYQISLKILWGRITGTMENPDTSKAKIPVVKPYWLPPPSSPPSTPNSNDGKLKATWLGHSCYYVEYPSGVRVLFDPVFEDRCTPTQWFGPKRYSPPGCAISDLPPVDAVVISHSHYDHLSHPSVLEVAKHNPEAHFFVGLGLEKWFRSAGIEKVTELDWWRDAELVLTRKDAAGEDISARISCLPCQHSSGRTGRDKDTTLWCSWAVSSGNKSVWFGGDTGYRNVPTSIPPEENDYKSPEYDSLPRCPHFGNIGRLRGPFDLGLIPIGAYKPRWMWSGVHSNPYDAVEIFKETRCQKAMGIHWGTWVLTSEEVEEPPRMLKEALRTSGIPETGVFDVCAVGETREF